MTQHFRLPAGGMIERGRVLGFRFDGREYQGHPGDTLASALLANGIRVVARSFKYHRPRGIMTAGIEEPSALVRLETGDFAEPNRRPTDIFLYDGLRAGSQHAWPLLGFDLAALADRFAPLLPAGFYYKTFMGPGRLWRLLWEPLLRHMAGLGRAPEASDPSRYDKRHEHCDVLVVGGGPAGLAAALAAGRRGIRVILAHRDSELGGGLLRRPARIGEADSVAWVRAAVAELDAMPQVRLLRATTVLGWYDDNYLIAAEKIGERIGPRAPAGLPRQRLWHIRARRIVLATGAIERPPVFPDNDRPGIMLAGAVETYLHRFAVMAGRRAVLFVNNDGAYPLAPALAREGITVAAIIDPRPEPGIAARRLAEGIPLFSGHAVIGTAGRRALRHVWARPAETPGTMAEVMAGAGRGRAFALDCDLLAVSGGWNPNVQLFAQARGRLRFDPDLASLVPGECDAAVVCAGAANGIFLLPACLAEGERAGIQAAALCGFGAAGHARQFQVEPQHGANPAAAAVPIASSLFLKERWAAGERRRAFVDLHNDVTAADIALAAREGYAVPEHLKRYTTLGMGTDQGKTGNLSGLALLAAATGQSLAETAPTTFRPPYAPVSYGLLAGRERGHLADPLRVTPMHDWHRAAGAVFEDVGQWDRARCYPRPGEDIGAAVRRECLAARDRVALLDASTLGQIEVTGPDAARFLDRIYINRWENIEIGACRYGVMCREDGMVFDDGVGTRLAEDRFLLTTTTGNAGAVLDWLEEWLQTEWTDLDVFCTSVTEQWANATLVGPRARDVLAGLAPGLALDTAAFPFMRMREAEVAGIPARIFRVSFSGELSYEINVPADFGLALWERLIASGEACGIAPYGTEAMHVLRAEKGYIIVGQETDGSVTPLDLGFDVMIARGKDFLGRRSLARSDTLRPDRKQLVGLLPDDPAEVLPEGAQLVAATAWGSAPPHPTLSPTAGEGKMEGIGHVTSSYYGARIGRSFALALVAGGRARHGERVWAPSSDRTVAARICPPVFYDAAGLRRDG